MAFTSELTQIPPDMESRRRRSSAVMDGQSHQIYQDNAIYTNYSTHWQLSSEKIGTPTDLDPLIPQVVCCGNAKEAARLLRANVGKPKFPYGDVLVGDGVLGQTDPAEWRKQRECLRPAFRAPVVSQLMQLMHEHTVRHITDEIDIATLRNAEVDIHHLLMVSSFGLIGRVVLGQETKWMNTNGERLRSAFASGLQPLYKDTPEGQAAQSVMTEFAEHAWEAGRRRREGDPLAPPTVVDRLMKSDTSAQKRQDELMTIMFAGHETTANTLSWCMYELSNHQRAQQRVRADIWRIMHQSGRRSASELTLQDLGKATLLTAAIRECMRLWPVVANGAFRVISENSASAHVENCDTPLPAGTPFQVPHWTFHRDPHIWGANADKFDLDRYKSAWNHDAFMPFSKPPRDCIGRHFAMASMRVTLAHLLLRYTFTPLSGGGMEPPKRGTNWATLQPEGGVVLRIAHAKNPSKL